MNERESTDRTGLSTADIAGTSERVSSPETTESNDSNVTRFDRGNTDAAMTQDSSVESENETPLLPDGESYRTRWQEIQGTFVDDPRESVSKADGLVAEAIQTLAKRFAAEGIAILDGPRRTGDGYYECVVRDPEGNRVEIAAGR